jgi:hypothetical protein
VSQDQRIQQPTPQRYCTSQPRLPHRRGIARTTNDPCACRSSPRPDAVAARYKSCITCARNGRLHLRFQTIGLIAYCRSLTLTATLAALVQRGLAALCFCRLLFARSITEILPRKLSASRSRHYSRPQTARETPTPRPHHTLHDRNYTSHTMSLCMNRLSEERYAHTFTQPPQQQSKQLTTH